MIASEIGTGDGGWFLSGDLHGLSLVERGMVQQAVHFFLLQKNFFLTAL